LFLVTVEKKKKKAAYVKLKGGTKIGDCLGKSVSSSKVVKWSLKWKFEMKIRKETNESVLKQRPK